MVLLHLTAAANSGSTEAAWNAMGERRLEDAKRLFQEARRQGDESARTEFGLALARLNAQPRTRGSLEAARRTFTSVATDHPGTEEGIRSRYFLARINQVHAYTPEPALAREAFLILLKDHPDHFFAQLGLTKVADIDLYDPTISAAERLARFEQLSLLGSALTHWAVRRDFHQIMARAALYFDMPLTLAQSHLMAALEAGFSSVINRGDIVFRAAEVARKLKQDDLARSLYDEFLNLLPVEPRARLARERRDSLTPIPDSAP